MTELSRVVCLTIVAETILEQRLTQEIQKAGANGWTISPAQGQGPRGRRVSEIGGGNVRFDVLVSEGVADRIWSLLQEKFFPDYAITAWSSEVRVARPERYLDEGPASK